MHILLCRCMDLTYNEYCNYVSSICFYCKYCKYSICSLIGPALLAGIAVQPCSGSPVGFMEPCLIQAWLTPSQRSEGNPHTDWLANFSCFRLPKFQSLPPKLSKTLYRLGLPIMWPSKNLSQAPDWGNSRAHLMSFLCLSLFFNG